MSKPRITGSWTLGMKRLAEHLGWYVESEGKTWVAVPDDEWDLNPFRGKALDIIGHMLTVALWPAPAGLGMTPKELRDVMNVDVRRESRTGDLMLPASATGSVEAMLGRVFGKEGR